MHSSNRLLRLRHFRAQMLLATRLGFEVEARQWCIRCLWLSSLPRSGEQHYWDATSALLQFTLSFLVQPYACKAARKQSELRLWV